MWTAIKTGFFVGALTLTFAVHAAVLAPFTATYTAKRGFLSLGTATFQLQKAGSCWNWHGFIDPNFLASFVVGKTHEDSRFCAGPDGQLQALTFHQRQEGGGNTFRQTFNWSDDKVTYHNGDETKTMSVPKGTIDVFLMQIGARQWLANAGDDPANARPTHFTVVDKDRVRTYTLHAQDGGTIKTPAGTFHTVRIARVNGGKHKLVFWTAPKLDFLPVRVERQANGKTQIQFNLAKLQTPPDK